MTTQISTESGHHLAPVSLPPELKRTHPSNNEQMTNESKKDQTESRSPPSKPRWSEEDEEAAPRRRSPGGGAVAAEVNGRERLKRHRVEVAGRVWIPEMWGQEELLKDWIDCTAFDASLVNSTIMSARAALVEEGRIRVNSSGIRIENRC